MRNKLLATVALSAAIGYATLAAAQNAPSGSQTGRETLSPKGAEPHMKTAPQGAMTPRHGSQSAQTETAPSGQTGQQPIPEKIQPKDEGANTQSEHGLNAPERRSQKDELQRGAQKDESQHGAQNENSERGSMNAAHERTGEGTETKANGPRGKSAQLSVEQRTKIKGIIGRGHVARVDHPDFSVRVGTVVPRSVHVTVLPSDIVEVVPQYRGYDYVLVGDEILIVDPHSLEIVAILEA